MRRSRRPCSLSTSGLSIGFSSAAVRRLAGRSITYWGFGECGVAEQNMNRRDLVTLLGAACFLSPPAAAAQKMPKIGFLSWFPTSMSADLDRFREGMQQF